MAGSRGGLLAGYHARLHGRAANRGFQTEPDAAMAISSVITRTQKDWMVEYNEQLIYVMDLYR
jgi:hypothetical protein